MVAFRKVYVLAALALLLGLATSASAQITAFSCNASAAVPPTLRQEGLTELTGDIVLDCTGGVPTPQTPAVAPSGLCPAGTIVVGGVTQCLIPQVNFSVYTTAPITSRLTGTSNSLPQPSEALLLVDEPTSSSNPSSPLLYCTSSSGCAIPGTSLVNGFPGPEPYSGATSPVSRPNVFQGTVVATNQVQFIGVPVDAPGTTTHRIFRFTNIRVNANAVSAGASGTPGQVQALISASGSTSVPINNPTQVVGFVQPGMAFSVRTRGTSNNAVGPSDISFPQCTTLSNSPSSAPFNSFVLQYAENFPTAFKIRVAPGGQTVPGNIYNTESGFGNLFGVADSGTRLKAAFANIPAGVSVYVATTNAAPASVSATLLLNEAGTAVAATSTNTLNCNGGSVCSGTSAAAYLLPVTNGTATAVWEIQSANPLASETVTFGVWFAYTAAQAQNSPPPGTASVTGSFAPTPASLGFSASDAATPRTTGIPRFVDGTQRSNVFTIYPCRSNLLFPFVTNQSGFDTGLAISNTSTDPFGTAAQAGNCTMYPYGANAPASFPTPNIGSGTTYATLASSTMPGFQGYVIATCQFQFAHGFAFISDFGARNLAMGYLALVIPEPGAGSRTASSEAASASGAGEQLAQ